MITYVWYTYSLVQDILYRNTILLFQLAFPNTYRKTREMIAYEFTPTKDVTHIQGNRNTWYNSSIRLLQGLQVLIRHLLFHFPLTLSL